MTAEVVGQSLDGLAAMVAELLDALASATSCASGPPRPRHITRHRGLVAGHAQAANNADGPLSARWHVGEDAPADWCVALGNSARSEPA